MSRPLLIALDWGTTQLRAALLGTGGRVLEQRGGGAGVMAVAAGAFEAELRRLCGDWIDRHAVPLLASGMVGSRQGWVEAPYRACPARLADVAAALTPVPLAGGATLHVVPGLLATGPDGEADVLRGEETQVWGAGLPAGAVAVLPGTHSKWLWCGADDSITGFQTWMTGELFALLSRHSILGRLMEPGPHDAGAFADGVAQGLADPARLTHRLFGVRSGVLTGRRPGTAASDHLSGLLIGAEIAGACRQGAPATVTLIGDDDLVRRYTAALAQAGIGARPARPDATPQGQWAVACAAGLVQETA